MRKPLLWLFWVLPSMCCAQGSLSPGYLRCEYRVNPLGLDETQPRLSWELVPLDSGARGLSQMAYEIRVASSERLLEKGNVDLWASGEVLSGETAQVEYAGKPLGSRQACFWQVRVRDQMGAWSDWSEMASWTMGLLKPEDWQAMWIGAAPEEEPPKPPPHYMHSGYHSAIAPDSLEEKWVAIDLGSTVEVDEVRLYPTQPASWEPDSRGYLFPKSFVLELSDSADFRDTEVLLIQNEAKIPDAGPWRASLPPNTGRYLRLRVTHLRPRNPGEYAFTLAEMEVLSKGENHSRDKQVLALDQISQPEWGWELDRLTDGWTDPSPMPPPVPDPPVPPSPLLRKSFEVQPKLKKALIYVTARGLYQLFLNGQKVGDRQLSPEWTDYRRRIQYQTYDVTGLVTEGENVLGAMLADGWYAGRIGPTRWQHDYPRRGAYGVDRRLLCQLELEYANGRREVIGSDGSWLHWPDGPIRKADNFLGETYDARKKIKGWDQSGFVPDRWLPVYTEKRDSVLLVAQPNEPIQQIGELNPIALSEPEPGVFIFDIGQNLAGWCRIRVKGEPGDTITLRHGEMLTSEGKLYTENLASAVQTDRFVLAGGGTEYFEPHFTYHGFRYVEVRGLRSKPSLDQLTARALASGSPVTGTFSCSNEYLNQLWHNIRWTQWSNMPSVPTDCPQRDERMGWMGDALVFARTAIYNLDMASFFSKWVQDIRDAQGADGSYPDFAPWPDHMSRPFRNAPGWADAGIVVPWRLYEHYGDTRVLQKHFESARKFIDLVHAQNPGLVWRNETGSRYGDWLNGNTIIAEDYPKTGAEVPHDAYATAFFAYSTRLLAEMATVLGEEEAVAKYGLLAARIRQTFLREFVDKEGKITGDSQAGYALALAFDLLPDSLQPLAMTHLLAQIDRYDGRISTGFQTTYLLMEVLSSRGHHDLACQLAESHRFPSWLYSIDQGATTVWERWDGYVAGRGFQDPGMNSFSHYAIGAVGEWMYRHLAGIQREPASHGWEKVRIAPKPGGSLTWVKGSYRSIRGTVSVSWEKKEGGLELALSIPPNTAAEVWIPVSGESRIRESGKDLEAAVGVELLEKGEKQWKVKVTSGTYRFSVLPYE